MDERWQADTLYSEGDLIWENDGEAFECIRGGPSGRVKPNFPVNSRIVVDDNRVMWRGYPRMNKKREAQYG